MGTNKKDSLWVRLKRAVRKVNFLPLWGDGGLFSDKAIITTKPQTDSTFVIKDSTVVTRPLK